MQVGRGQESEGRGKVRQVISGAVMLLLLVICMGAMATVMAGRWAAEARNAGASKRT